MEAAKSSGLSEPFVHILELSNFSVTYRVSGLLEDPKRLISARSKLYARVLDTLHGHGIEIMSPSFMNQRKIDDNTKIVPAMKTLTKLEEPESLAEDIAFDKAEQAEQLEYEKLQLAKEIEKLEASLKQLTDEDEKKVNKEELESMYERLKALKERPEISETENDNAEPDVASDK